jgi:hypothetical protein
LVGSRAETFGTPTLLAELGLEFADAYADRA